MKKSTSVTDELLALLDASSVNFLAAAYVENQLEAHGFQRLDAAEPLPVLKAGAILTACLCRNFLAGLEKDHRADGLLGILGHTFPL